jgi:hypothetical protein
LKLTDKAKEKAEAAVKAYQENVRKLTELARADLLLKMTDVLSADEYTKFKEALARQPALAPGGFIAGFRRGLSEEEIVERILSFDKNKDGKVTKEELPERMQNLIEKGDTNKDGALDPAEIKALAAKLRREGLPAGFDGFGGFGGGRGGFGGRGGPPGRPPGFGGGFATPGGFRPGGAERVLDDLRLTAQTREKAEAAVKTHQEEARKLMDLPRADLLLKMKEVLSGDDYKKFQEAVDRQPGLVPPGARRPADLERRLDQLQRDLDSLRREIRR